MPVPDPNNTPEQTWRERWYEIIFEADTPPGKRFDVALLIAILLSIVVMMLESVERFRLSHGAILAASEWFFTLLFTAEYVMRIVCAPRPWRYVFSFYGVVDLLAILPTYLAAGLVVFFPGAERAQRLAVVRALRLLRAFRIFKLGHMLSEAGALRAGIWAARAKLAVFLTFILVVIVIAGSAMHVIEGPESGFTSIPQSMYWAVVTMTTVGYGDIAPVTPLGKTVAAVMMLMGYSVLIVPIGIISAELVQVANKPLTTQVCPECMKEGHDADARHCKFCGAEL